MKKTLALITVLATAHTSIQPSFALQTNLDQEQSMAPNLIAQCANTNLATGNYQRGVAWQTCNGYKLIFQNDGNLVIYSPAGQPLWATGTYGYAQRFAIQSDGNAVLYDASNQAIWASNTYSRGRIFALQVDGNFVVYDGNGQPVYATGTDGGQTRTFSAAQQWGWNPNPNNPTNPDIAINAIFDANITPNQRTQIIKAIENWDSIITRDMVNQGPLKIYIRNGNMTRPGQHWAETSTLTDGSRSRYRPIYSNGYYAIITLRSGLNLSDNNLIRLATHELGHAMLLNEAESDQSLGTNGIMHSTGLYQFIPEGTYRKLEWLGYSVNRNPSLKWQ